MHSFTNYIFNKAQIFRLQRSLQLTFVLFCFISFQKGKAQCPNATPIAATTICSGAITAIALTSDLGGTTYTWTAVQTDVVGASDCSVGCGSTIADTLTAVEVYPGTVTYTVTPFTAGCPGGGLPILVNITVNPIPLAIASNSTICSGATSSVAITSDVVGTTFAWTVIQAGVSGASPGSGSLIAQTLNTTGASSGIATYNITPTAGGCVGEPINTKVTVRQLPALTLGANPQVCVGTLTANLTYSSSGGGANQYSVNYDAIAEGQGFVDVVNQVLPASPIVLVVPGGAVVGVYNAIVSVNNTINGCPGASYPITVTIRDTPTPANAGPDQTLPCGVTSANLAANAPVVGIGSWSISSGAGGSFVLATDPNTVFNGTSGITYVLTWTISNAPCPASTNDVTITLTPLDDASFNYSASSYCQTDVDPIPTITGLPGGTFSSTAGLVFVSTATGEIDLSGSTLGTYIISYTTTGPCPNIGTFSVTITLSPDATFSYTGTPYCQNGVDPFPTFPPGASAGTFSSTAGLVFVSTATGEVDLSASTVGTYTVTNTIAASGGCP
ncbi:MAG: PKD-like domain-containing protein, partial [Bacteroidota bacterium]|nr:PKD-like domain-containing protein [Bacteroidota bacterium]